MIEKTSIPLFTYTFQNNFSVSFEVVGIDAEFNPTTEVLTITKPDGTKIPHNNVTAFECKPLFRA